MKELVYSCLDKLGIPYQVTLHDPVYTIADMEALGLDKEGLICKNLFIRDSKGKRHFLVVADENTHVNLKFLGDTLGVGKLSFASDQRLGKYLGVTVGAVSPFGLLNDSEHTVTVVLDQNLLGRERLGVHPNDNTATVWLSWRSLVYFIDAQGNERLTTKLSY